MIPIMLNDLEKMRVSVEGITDIVGIACMAPGPVAINAAVGLGYKVAGFPGVIAAFLGVSLPCAIIVILVATFFFKIYTHPMVKAALYGLRPVITGIIIYAAVKLALQNSIIAAAHDQLIKNGINVSFHSANLFELKSLLMVVAAFTILVRTKVHPILIIICFGIFGVFLF